MSGTERLHKTGQRGRPKKPDGADVTVGVRLPTEIVAQLDADAGALSRSEAVRLLVGLGLGIMGRLPLTDEARAMLARLGWRRDNQ